MGAEIAAAIMNMSAPPEVQEKVIELWQKIAGAMVKHIQDNAKVQPGIGLQAGPYSGSTNAEGSIQ